MARGPIPDKPQGRPTVPEVAPLVRAYLDKHFNGGNLHLVLADGNLGDHFVEYELRRAREAGDSEGEAIAEAMLAMTGTQRRRLYRLRRD